MKKIISILLVIAMMFSFSACGKDEKTEENNGNDTVQVDEGLLFVDITAPANMFEGKSEQDIIKEAEDDGYKCVVNEDGSVTYTMTKKQQKEMLREMKEDIDDQIDDILNGGGSSSFESITYGKNFESFEFIVNERYDNYNDALTAIGFLIYGSYYQIFSGVDMDDVDCVITCIDSKSGEEVNQISYRELMG